MHKLLVILFIIKLYAQIKSLQNVLDLSFSEKRCFHSIKFDKAYIGRDKK